MHFFAPFQNDENSQNVHKQNDRIKDFQARFFKKKTLKDGGKSFVRDENEDFEEQKNLKQVVHQVVWERSEEMEVVVFDESGFSEETEEGADDEENNDGGE